MRSDSQGRLLAWQQATGLIVGRIEQNVTEVVPIGRNPSSLISTIWGATECPSLARPSPAGWVVKGIAVLGLCPALENSSCHRVRTQHSTAAGADGTHPPKKNAEVEEQSLRGSFRLQSLSGLRVSKIAYEHISARMSTFLHYRQGWTWAAVSSSAVPMLL